MSYPYPHVPAAFINAIAEEGTKSEAVEWLQKEWNENCDLREINKAMLAALQVIAAMADEDNEWDGTDKFQEARERARAALNSGTASTAHGNQG